jgi:hypothetical protein
MNKTESNNGLKQLVLEKYDKIGQSSLQQKENRWMLWPDRMFNHRL